MGKTAGLVRRIPFALACAIALFVLVVAVSLSQLAAARAGDDLVEGAAPFLTDQGLATMRADLEQIDGTLSAIVADPDFADRVRSDPALAEAVARLPEIYDLVSGIITNLEQRQEQFDDAAELPGAGLDLEQAEAALLGLAGVGLIVSVIGLLRPRRWAAAVVLAAGLVMAGAPLALGHLGKAESTDELLDSLRPFSTEKVAARESSLAAVRTVFDAYDGTTVPPDELEETSAALDRYTDLVDFSRYAQPRLVDATPTSASTGIWLSIAEGAVLAAAGAMGLVVSRGRRSG